MDEHAIISGQHDETALALKDWIADHNEALPQQRRQEKACSDCQGVFETESGDPTIKCFDCNEISGVTVIFEKGSTQVDMTGDKDDEDDEGEHQKQDASSTLSVLSFFMNLVAHNLVDYVAPWNNCNYMYVKSATESVQTKLFCCVEMTVPLLYWYTPYHGILTSKMHFICPVGLTNGLVLVALWRTRCNDPINHAIFYDPVKDECYMKKQGWNQIFIDLEFKFIFDTVKK